jgi:hypothetical protein
MIAASVVTHIIITEEIQIRLLRAEKTSPEELG